MPKFKQIEIIKICIDYNRNNCASAFDKLIISPNNNIINKSYIPMLLPRNTSENVVFY